MNGTSMNITKQRLDLIKENEAQRITIEKRDKDILRLNEANGVLLNENGELEKKYDGLISFLSDYLFNKTNNVYKEENAIKEQINNLLIANTEPTDNVMITDEYISKVERVGMLIRPTDIPDDIGNGYWKLVDGKYILDKEKYNQMWSVI